ncbi:MAG: LPS-assembly protein LptD [Wenzhouxiangellaceae bacterium]|nr:MAG: LPS-assembly protein LptD [Wenzhouxiangellaceae bacterium]
MRVYSADSRAIVILFRTLALSVFVGLALPSLAPAQAPAGTSDRPALVCVEPDEESPRRRLDRSGGTPLRIFSEHFQAQHEAPVRFEESVRVEHGDQRLETETLIYNRQTGRIELPVLLRYSDAVIALEAERGWVETEASRARFEGVEYRFVRGEGSGEAGLVELLNPTMARVEGFSFTTCDPARPDWQLKAGQVRLDMERGQGVARHARLEFKGVPILYSPWLSFPLDDQRKSGFLYPSLGFSSDDGFDLRVPWYWNIAPNQDATLTPRWIQDRGVMLATEYRFLTARQRGQIDVEFLPSDREADINRYYGQFDWTARLAPRWSARADLRRASDDNYFVDLGSDLADSAVQFLRSSIGARGNGQAWSLDVMADAFQVLDENVAPGNEPYRRLPRIRLDVDQPLARGFEFMMDNELVYFDRDAGITGARFDAHPRLRYNLIRPGWFVRPELGLRSTFYQLSGAESSSPSRTTPIASFDAGLIFERRTGRGRVQTLEPRLFYLYVPFANQDDLPNFDTRELTFGMSQLFHHNRFSGPDRQGDANQLTLALSSRLLDATDGRSQLEASIGQIFYFRDLEVQLPGEPVDQRSRSATVAEMFWRPARQLVLSAGLQWDHEESETQVARFGLSFRGRDGRQAQLGYRYRRDRVDQADIRFRYPLRRNINLIGRVNYSFEDRDTLELLGGIEYESCCWALRLTGREYIRDRDSEMRRTVFMELHLKGLGSLGRRPYPLFTHHQL